MNALPISMLRFKSINFYQNSLKIKPLWQKKKTQNFQTLGASDSPLDCEFLATRLSVITFQLFVVSMNVYHSVHHTLLSVIRQNLALIL